MLEPRCVGRTTRRLTLFLCLCIKSKAVGIKGLIGKGSVAETVLAKSEVFMIRYRSGMSDIITPVENTEVNKPDNILQWIRSAG